MLGAHDEPTTYRKAELKTFVSLGVEDMLGADEVSLLGSVLEFSGKTVSDIMVGWWSMMVEETADCQTPREDLYCLSAEKIVVRLKRSRPSDGMLTIRMRSL
jgi:metal transporter CNNM